VEHFFEEFPMATAEHSDTDSPRIRRYRKAAELLERWMSEDGNYDEHTWPAVDIALQDSAARCGEQDAIAD